MKSGVEHPGDRRWLRIGAGVFVAVLATAGCGGDNDDTESTSDTTAAGSPKVSGVGDEAFFAGTNLNVRKGDTGLILFVGRTNSPPPRAGRHPRREGAGGADPAPDLTTPGN